MTTFVVAVVMLSAFLFPATASAQRQMEALGRGVVAVRQADGRVWLGWRPIPLQTPQGYAPGEASAGDLLRSIHYI